MVEREKRTRKIPTIVAPIASIALLFGGDLAFNKSTEYYDPGTFTYSGTIILDQNGEYKTIDENLQTTRPDNTVSDVLSATGATAWLVSGISLVYTMREIARGLKVKKLN